MPRPPSRLRVTCGNHGKRARPGGKEDSEKFPPVLLSSLQLFLCHLPPSLIKELLCPKESGSAAFYSQNYRGPISSHPIPRLSLPNSRMGSLDKMLTEEAGDPP